MLKQIHPERCQLCRESFFWKRGKSVVIGVEDTQPIIVWCCVLIATENYITKTLLWKTPELTSELKKV